MANLASTWSQQGHSEKAEQLQIEVLQEALSYHSVKFVRKLLIERFDLVAQGEYAWLHEWDEMGFSRDEMAEFLLEDVNDSPWIYFEAGNIPHIEIQPGIHMPGCIHQICSSNLAAADQPQLRSRISRPDKGNKIITTVQELCGLAGIAPISRNLDEWTGTVKFKEQNSIAIVSYAIREDEEVASYHALVHRIAHALQNLCAAVSHVQAAGLCCGCFTVLRQPPHNNNIGNIQNPRLELLRIDLELPKKLLEELKVLLHLEKIAASNLLSSETIATKILGSITKDLTVSSTKKDVDSILHLCSMSVQFLCLGFLSYIQAHVGPIRPFFLDSPLRKILLMGSGWSEDRGYIVAEFKNLTCIGTMIQGSAFAFNMIQTTDESPKLSDNQLEYDVLTSAENLLDTWGPGSLIIRRGSEQNPCGIKICNGIVCAAEESGTMFHWSHQTEFDQTRLEKQFKVSFDPRKQIVIGASVITNSNCSIDEKECWQRSSNFFSKLGTHRTYWEPSERQFGLQGGYSNVTLQAIQTWCKFQGKTLKQIHLEQHDLLIPFLESAWGLQVSFCTGVARRIPLRELVAELLPVFAETLRTTRDDLRLWEDLNSNHNIVDIFYRGNLRDDIDRIGGKLYKYIWTLVQRILEILGPTGVDTKGERLTIAWPRYGDIQRCFKIQCRDQSTWARLLADSEDCATFSYISSKCLESDQVKCKSSDTTPAWKNATTLLETAVIRHQSTSTPQSSKLEHKKSYYFEKLDSLFVVKVHRPDATSIARLDASRSELPSRLQNRMFRTKKWKTEYRIRERQEAQEPAEQVLVWTP
ncbi:hypothetical protein BTUL_0137g00360 [Botrytis tulipae]|uniref:Uncharacterized protein n=1 Tax=Botrytis tulipae TaxID=87230 RepID=A0A4Z1EGQ0_9HELO|nr:hypothetical protein BTUL_0137g00360 [Botrytis tulipae]